MIDVRVRSIQEAIDSALDHLVVQEREPGAGIRDALLFALTVGTFMGLIMAAWGGLAIILCMAIYFFAVVIFAVMQALKTRTVCLLAYREYFVVLRSVRSRFRPNVTHQPGHIVAIFERSSAIRPQERAVDGANAYMNIPLVNSAREIIVFVDGRVWILLQTVMILPDEGLEQLHKINAFFQRNNQVPRDAQQADFSPRAAPEYAPLITPAPAVQPKRPTKGTLK